MNSKWRCNNDKMTVLITRQSILDDVWWNGLVCVLWPDMLIGVRRTVYTAIARGHFPFTVYIKHCYWCLHWHVNNGCNDLIGVSSNRKAAEWAGTCVGVYFGAQWLRWLTRVWTDFVSIGIYLCRCTVNGTHCACNRLRCHYLDGRLE